MNSILKYQSESFNDSEKYLCDHCGHLLGSKDTFRHLMTTHHNITKEHQCSICSYSTTRLDSIRRHLKSNDHSKRARDEKKYIMDFLNPPGRDFLLASLTTNIYDNSLVTSGNWGRDTETSFANEKPVNLASINHTNWSLSVLGVFCQ